MKKIFIVTSAFISLTLAAQISFAKTTAAPDRAVANAQTPQDVGQKYLSIAHDLAVVRTSKKDTVCEFNAFQEEIYSVLAKARFYDDKIKPTAEIIKTLESSLAYRVMMGTGEELETTNPHPPVFVGTEFYGKAMGVYGYHKWFKLLASGKGEYHTLELLDNEPYYRWNKSDLSWNYINDKKRGPTLAIKIKMGASMKTLTYRIARYHHEDILNFGLVPGNREKKNKRSGREVWSTDFFEFEFLAFINGECEA